MLENALRSKFESFEITNWVVSLNFEFSMKIWIIDYLKKETKSTGKLMLTLYKLTNTDNAFIKDTNEYVCLSDHRK